MTTLEPRAGIAARPYLLLSIVLVLLNIAGIIWIRQGLVATPRSDTIRVQSTLPADGSPIDFIDHISIRFDAPVAAEEEVGTPLASPLFTMQPEIPGHWIYATPERLDFILSEPPPPATTFHLEPVPDASGSRGQHLSIPARITFTTRSPRIISCRLSSADPELATFIVEFNQPVDPQEIAAHCTVTSAEENPLEMTLLNKDVGTEHLLQVPRDGGDWIVVSFSPGLRGTTGNREIEKARSYRLDLPKRFALLHARIHGSGLNQLSRVTLEFSRPLDPEQSLPKISVTPELEQLQVQQPVASRNNVRVSRQLRIDGSFIPGKRYYMDVPASILSKDGQVLSEQRRMEIDVPLPRPELHLPHGHGVLSPHGNLLLDLKAVSIDAIHVDVSRVHANNLVTHLHGNGRTSSRSRTSRQLPRQTFTLSNNAGHQPIEAVIDLHDLAVTEPGIYSIHVRDTETWYHRDSAVINITDLAVITKRDHDGVLAWVASLRTARPVANVRVVVRSYNNQIMARATTDEEGLARLPLPPNHPDGKPWIVIAESEDDDLCYVRLDRTRPVPDGVDTTGRPVAATYDLFLSCERDVFRPGDPIRAIGLLRDGNGDIPSPFPIEIALERPDGRTIERDVVTPGEQGFFLVEFETDPDAMTGRWRLLARLPGSTPTLSSSSCWVEAFVPVRLAVDLESSAPFYGPGECPALDISSRYLWDAPASDLAFKLTGPILSSRFHSQAFPAFSFDPATDKRYELPTTGGRLDDQGRHHARLTLPDALGRGRWRADVAATVTVTGGRGASARQSIIIDTIDRHLGIRRTGPELAVAGTPTLVEWMVRTGSDERAAPRPLALRAQSIRREWVLKVVNGRRTWSTIEHLADVPPPVVGGEPGKDGVGIISFMTLAAGNYRLTVTEEAGTEGEHVRIHTVKTGETLSSIARMYCGESLPETIDSLVSLNDLQDQNVLVPGQQLKITSEGARRSFDLYVSGGVNAGSILPERPEDIDIVLDRSAYLPGDTAKVHLSCPFTGSLLLTLEADGILRTIVHELDETSIAIDLPLPADLRGGAFVAATVIRPVDPAEQSWVPHRAAGLVRLRIDHEPRRMALQLSVPELAEPASHIEVRIDLSHDMSTEGQPPQPPSSPPVLVAWAVDEGILRVAGTTIPDPFSYFLGERRYEIETADRFVELLPDHARPAEFMRIGADEDAHIRRRNPMPARYRDAFVVAPVLLYPDADGHVTWKVSVPDMTGALRLFVIGSNGDRYGSTEHLLTVRPDLLVASSWPRMMAPGDHARIPVRLANNTSALLACSLEIEADPGVLHIEAPGKPIFLAPGGTSLHWLDVDAIDTGPVTVLLHARGSGTGGSMLRTERTEFTVRPAAPLDTVITSHSMPAGDTMTFTAAEGFRPELLTAVVTVSAFPFVELEPALRALVRYPYGCVEQTSSSLLALLAADRVLGDKDGEASRADRRGMIAAGIDRLNGMQTPSGGIGYWPGATRGTLWGTTYALRVLVEAQDDGFAVDSGFLSRASGWIATETARTTSPGIHAWTALVQARLGHADPGELEWIDERSDKLDDAELGHLVQAWIAVGRRDRAASLLENRIFDGSSTTVRYSDRLTSPVYRAAVLLDACLALDPDAPMAAALATALLESRTHLRWYSTLENAHAVWALSSFQSRQDTPADFTGTVDGEALHATFDHESPALLELPVPGSPVQITSHGTGRLHATLQTEGLRTADHVRTYDRSIQARRDWRDRHGTPVDPATLSVGDLVVVEITLRSLTGASIPSIALVDRLPGGFEIEHPSLATSTGSSKTKIDAAQRSEFLDDRLLLFTTAQPTPTTFTYALRVTTAGTYAIPPVEASCMYDTRIASIAGGSDTANIKP